MSIQSGSKIGKTKTKRIELNLRDMNQLFNSMDPSPFNEKDLDQDAEEFIVSWAQEFSTHESISLRMYLDEIPSDEAKKQLVEAIHNYFSYRAKLTQMELGRLFKQGRTSLLIGITFLAFCFAATRFVTSDPNHPTWFGFLGESLTIAGWVAMWRPMQIYLYDWWPIRRREKVFKKLSKMPIDIVQKKKA